MSQTMKFPELSGERIRLIELDEGGLEDMHEYSKNPLLYKHLEHKPQKTIEDTRLYLRELIKRSELEDAHYWFVSLIETRKIIGSFGIHDIDLRRKSAELSYGLSPDYWGKGYFGEVLKVVLKYLFSEQGFHRISATTHYDNLASIKALEKAGFQREGTLRNFYLSYDGTRQDAAVLAILKPEYDAQDDDS